jgi:hypothetical protein
VISAVPPDVPPDLPSDVPPEQTCLLCGSPYEPGDRRCPSCGAELVRECPACGAPNPLAARKCLACGQELERLDSLFARVTGAKADWLRHVREEAPTIKAQEEDASRSRLEDMWAAETRRREALALMRAERDRQQRILVTVAVSMIALVVVVVLIAVVVWLSRAPSVF